MVIKDPPDPVVEWFTILNSADSPLIRRWTPPESGTFYVEVSAYEGTGSYSVSILRDDSPDGPAGVSAGWEGATVRVSWEPAEGRTTTTSTMTMVASMCTAKSTAWAMPASVGNSHRRDLDQLCRLRPKQQRESLLGRRLQQ